MTERIKDEDWYGEDLSGRSYADTEFARLDLTETTSSGGLVLDGCTIRGTKFNASEHTGASFANCVFIDCNFFGATFAECKFVGAQFRDCRFDQLTVDGGDWSFASLATADLHNATLRGARLREADLRSVRAAGATIRDCDLAGAQLAKIDLTKADLRGSDLSSLDPGQAELRGARIDATQAMTVALTLGLDVRD